MFWGVELDPNAAQGFFKILFLTCWESAFLNIFNNFSLTIPFFMKAYFIFDLIKERHLEDCAALVEVSALWAVSSLWMCSFALFNELNRVNVICFVADDDRDNQQKYVLEILIFFVLHSIVKCNIFLCYFFSHWFIQINQSK